jgi:hypothetical protein
MILRKFVEEYNRRNASPFFRAGLWKQRLIDPSLPLGKTAEARGVAPSSVNKRAIQTTTGPSAFSVKSIPGSLAFFRQCCLLSGSTDGYVSAHNQNVHERPPGGMRLALESLVSEFMCGRVSNHIVIHKWSLASLQQSDQ